MSMPNDSDAMRLRHIAEVVLGNDEEALRKLIDTDPLVRAIARIGKQPPNGMVGATLALTDLRESLRSIRWPHLAYAKGHEPTAADNCRHVLELIDWALRQIALYIGDPSAGEPIDRLIERSSIGSAAWVECPLHGHQARDPYTNRCIECTGGPMP